MYCWQVLWDSPTQTLINHISDHIWFDLLSLWNSECTKETLSLWCHLAAERETVHITPPKHCSITLPVHEIRMRHHPGLEHPPKLDLTLRWRQQLIVLVTARDVHFNLRDKSQERLNERRKLLMHKICRLEWTQDDEWRSGRGGLRQCCSLWDHLKYLSVDSQILTRLEDRHFTNKVNYSTGWWIIQLFNNLNQCEDY